MLRAVRGIYRGGVVELLERPEIIEEAEVVVTFLSELGAPSENQQTSEETRPLDDFEPIVPAKPIRLSDIVLEDRG